MQNYQYVFANVLTLRNCYINVASVHTDCKVYFEYLDFSHTTKLQI
jgi:hypothetical protein